MQKRLRNRRLIVLLLIWLIVPGLSRLLMEWLPKAHYLELLAYDWHCRALPDLPPDPRIVLIGMDDATIDKLPRGLLPRPSYPLPRTVHAQMVDKLRAAGAKVIGFDVMFTRALPDEDPTFAAALKRHGKVVSALLPEVNLAAGRETFRFTEPAPLLRPHLLAGSILAPRVFGKVRWFLPYPADEKTAKRYLHLSVALAAAYSGDTRATPVIRAGRFQLGQINAPIGDAGEILIRYAGPPGTFQAVPYHEVFNGTWKRTRGADFWRDKIVLIGVVNRLEDRHNTPLDEMQGLEILAHETQTVLQGNWLRHWSEAANYAVKAALCLVLILALWKMGLRLALEVALIEALFWGLLSHHLFVRTGIWSDTVEPLGALATTYVLVAGIEAWRLRRVFQRFLPAEVADEVLTTDLGAAVMAEREATVVFCDVRNYTALSEELTSEQIEELLRLFFEAGDEAAEALGEELDKYVGDEIMLHFEDRPGMEPHAVRAVHWGLAMQEAATRIHASGLAGAIGFHVGVGICTGPVRIGTVGARRRLQPTVIGDAVNVASRLQEVTKAVGRDIVLSESTWRQLGGAVKTELIGDVSVRGKQEPLRVYTPLRVVDRLNRTMAGRGKKPL